MPLPEPLERTVAITQSDRKLAHRLQNLVAEANDLLRSGEYDRATGVLADALEDCPQAFPGRSVILHNFLYAQTRAILQSSHGEPAALANRYAAVQKIPTDDVLNEPADFRKQFAGLLHELGLLAQKKRLGTESLWCYRQALALYQHPSFHVNLANTLTSLREPALLSDYTQQPPPQALGQHIFIACVPKSGSTYLKNLLCHLTDFQEAVFFGPCSQFQQEVYLPALLEYASDNTVTQQHARATEANIQLLQAFGIKSVVLVRNIYDCVVSLADFYAQGAARPTVFYGTFESLNRTEQIDLVIDHLVPWYFEFVASWLNAQAEQRLEILWLRYEDLVSDRDRSLLAVAKFYDIRSQAETLSDRLANLEAESKSNRFNQGISGRGQTELTAIQKARIASFQRHFPNVDFSATLGVGSHGPNP